MLAEPFFGDAPRGCHPHRQETPGTAGRQRDRPCVDPPSVNGIYSRINTYVSEHDLAAGWE
jgi:hypothetical protein